MNSTDFVLSVIAAFGGQVDGRTLLQKRAYFVSMLTGIDPGLNFDAHYYGPYSATVDNTLARLRALGFVNEENIGFGVASSGFEVKRYDYRLTEDGQTVTRRLEASTDYNKITDAVQRIIEVGNPNYVTLSIAAKAIFTLRKRGQGMSTSDMVREAQKFDWDLTSESLNSAVGFLERLHLVQRGPGNSQ